MISFSEVVGRDRWISLSGFLLGMALVYGLCSVMSYVLERLGNGTYDGYDLAPGNWDIQRDRRVIVNPAIVDYDVVGNHILGLRLPLRRFECDGGKEFGIELVNSLHYFVLRIDTGVVYEFTSRAMFEEKLVGFGISRDVSLDYTEAQRKWSRVDRYYGDVDYSMCTEVFDA